MGSLSDVRLGDIFQALGRYRPVLITIGVILLLVAVVPKPEPETVGTAGASVQGPVAPVEATPDTAVDAGSENAPPTTTIDSGTSDFASPAPTFSSPSSSDDFSSGSSGSDSFTTPTTSGGGAFTVTTTPATTTTTEPRPLRVVGSGWASATAATPLGSTGVPAGSLPAGKRIGQVDKYSFVRLAGDETFLRLKEVPEGARSTTGEIGVSACEIKKAGWPEKENVPTNQAPAYDSTHCAIGQRSPDGSWTFNLLAFPERTGTAGFALVPTGSSVDYQVAFAKA